MSELATSWNGLPEPGTQFSPGVFIAMASMEEELARCQPTEHDFNHTLGIVEARSQAIEDDPLNAVAYSDRALALAFLGLDQESRLDQEQAARLGLDRQVVAEETALVRRIAIGYPDMSAKPAGNPLVTGKVGWLSILSAFTPLLGR